MLPAHYCDYLLALYNQGEELSEPGRKQRQQKINIGSAAAAFALSAIAIFILYFTEIPILLQTVILTSFVGLLLAAALFLAGKRLFSPLLFLGAAIMMMALSLKVSESLFNNDPNSLYALLFLNCVLWVFIGIRLKLVYFSISGVLGAGVLLYFIVAY